jgi:beta-xylosidase
MAKKPVRSAGAIAVTIALIASVLAMSPASQALAAPEDHLVLRYALDETTGATVADSSGHSRDGSVQGNPVLTGSEGYRLDGVDDYVRLPDNVVAGLDSISVSVDVLVRQSQAGSYFIWGLGNAATSNSGTGYMYLTGNTTFHAGITPTYWNGEQTAASTAALTRGVWKTATYTLDDATDTARLYLDGVQVGQSTTTTVKPSVMGGGVTTQNFLGRSNYAADKYLAGSVRDFRIYDTALSASEVAALAPTDQTRVDREVASLTLGDISAVTSNLTLPTPVNGATVSWSSSDTNVVSNTGAVTRPASNKPDATVTLTATISRGSVTAVKPFTVTVLKVPANQPTIDAQTDLDAVVIPNASDVRGNITLPATGSVHGTAITWSASPAGAISTTMQGGKAPGVVTRGATDAQVTLTGRVAGTDASRAIAVTVKAAPAGLDTDYDAGYVWTHFAATDYEKIYLGHSEDGLHWDKLNDNKSVLSNLAGTLGVRDPHLVRSPDGDTYWILGTDLHAEGSASGGSWDQVNASQKLVVWESTDLVNWSDQSLVFAGLANAGNVWAPEAYWDETTGQYYVYWSGRDKTQNGTDNWALRVYLTKTRDFTSFTTPTVWLDENSSTNNADGPNIIDTTIAKEGSTYYRFSTSDWRTVVDTATSLDGPWTRVIARGEDTAHGLSNHIEGLTVYQIPDGRWVLMGDSGGYQAFVTESLSSLRFTALNVGSGANQYSFSQAFRHGSVLRLSTAEETRLLAEYGNTPVEPDPEPGDITQIAEYTFDDGTLSDSLGSNDLTKSGTAAIIDDPAKGNSLHLDGTTNGFASFPTGMFDNRNSMTVSMDVKSEKTSGNFFTFTFGKDSTKYYFFRVRGGEVRSAITQNSYSSESAVTGTLTSGAWHHINLVFNGSTMSVYSDGVLLGTNSALNTKVSDLGAGLVAYLGKSLYAADGYFAGSFDNVRVYSGAMTATQVLTEAGVTDQLLGISLADPSVLKTAPIIDATAHTAVFPVKPGTDVSAVAPTFSTAPGVTVSPASGTTVDLRSPVTYTLTAEDGDTTTWTFSVVEMKSPIIPGLYADPNIAVFGGTYYLYATTDGTPGWGGNTFYVWKSTDLVNWTRSTTPILTLDGANGNVPWASGNAWAPTIIERDGKYYFYFSGHNASLNRKTIGVAVADSPDGPFTAQPKAMILNDEAVRTGQAIDPAAFTDPETGKYYLFWGNGTPAVYAELSDDMLSIKASTIKAITGLMNFREGSFVNYRNGTYYLTWAIDDTGSVNYSTGYATASSIDGPWTNRGVILQKRPELGILATGHSSIIQVPGTDDWYIAYHRFAIPGGNGTNRETTIDKLEFNEDGTIKPVVPTLESVDPELVPDPAPLVVTVSGRARPGTTLSATVGAGWTAEAYQWLRDGEDITGATASTYTVTRSDLGREITVRVTGEKALWPGSIATGSAGIVALPELGGLAPVIAGTAKVGSTLSTDSPWTGDGVHVTYQWARDGAAVPGATQRSYALTAADFGAVITVTATGSKDDHATSHLTSAGTLPVAAGDLVAVAPTISGSAMVGKTLRATTGSWGPTGVALDVQWLRNGSPVAHATGMSYALVAADKGASISVRVTVAAPGYTTIAVGSASTERVEAGLLKGGTPKIVGKAKVGKKLTLKAGTWKPADVKLTYQWYRSGTPITHGTKSTYTIRGADEGKKIAVKVTGKKSGYTTLVTKSKATGRVR